ncbi:MAG: hypothetical protein FJX75_28700 [Armatimonadetes bacterium]|nr:hypothetical protein [Armatimonadota bacterium]
MPRIRPIRAFCSALRTSGSGTAPGMGVGGGAEGGPGGVPGGGMGGGAAGGTGGWSLMGVAPRGVEGTEAYFGARRSCSFPVVGGTC